MCVRVHIHVCVCVCVCVHVRVRDTSMCVWHPTVYLQVVVESSECLNEQVSPLVGELISEGWGRGGGVTDRSRDRLAHHASSKCPSNSFQ